MPDVSVVIPVYNGANFLRQAIESALAQTHSAVEVLVVDDGSTDNTWEIIQSYGDLVRGYRKSNGGVATALNVGIREMRGRWFAWLSHDDLFLPAKIERQVGFLRAHPQFRGCYTDYFAIESGGEIRAEVRTPWYPRSEALRALFAGTYISGSTMVVERECFDRVGLFSEHLRFTQDAEMWLRLLGAFEIGRVPEVLAKERSHPAQGSRSVTEHRAEAARMFCDVFETLGVTAFFPDKTEAADDPRVLAAAYEWLGDTLGNSRALHDAADEQYRRSAVHWPSWRNPARSKAVIGSARLSLPAGLLRMGRGFMVAKARAVRGLFHPG